MPCFHAGFTSRQCWYLIWEAAVGHCLRLPCEPPLDITTLASLFFRFITQLTIRYDSCEIWTCVVKNSENSHLSSAETNREGFTLHNSTRSERCCHRPLSYLSVLLLHSASVYLPDEEWWGFFVFGFWQRLTVAFLCIWQILGISVFPRYLEAITFVFPFMLMLAWVLFVADFVKKLVHERELRLHEVWTLLFLWPQWISHWCLLISIFKPKRDTSIYICVLGEYH